MLDLDFAQLSDPGRVRDNNEDYLGHCQPATPDEGRSHGWLFALADGVGGHDRGEVASRAAVEHLLAGFRAAPPGEDLGGLLTRLVRDANTHVYETARTAAPGGSNMATTLVTCALRHDRAVVAHAGDSRCYLVREGEARALTRDHTAAQEHVLSRSLGTDLFLNVETSEHTIVADDVLVLCSDGLHNAVGDEEMAAALRACPLDAAARRLADLANQRDGSDNISVQLVRIRSVERIGIYRGRPYKLR
jgi:protein phosphatase